jgi:hypothetical protein
MGLYKGRLKTVALTNDFGFIARETFERTDGVEDKELDKLSNDLFLHVNENPGLPTSLRAYQGKMLTFDIDFRILNKYGNPLVFDAELL